MAIIRHSARLIRRHPRYFVHLTTKKLQFAARFRWARQFGATDRPRPKPLVYKLMLNWRCNLRCPICMLWGETGWVKEESERDRQELPWSVIQKVFDSGLPYNSSFILSGGEPFLHSRMADLLGLLRERRKFAVICTNGVLLDRYADQFEDNPYPTLLISLDGDEPLNDELRGKGVFKRVMRGIETLQRLRRRPYIAVQFTIVPENVHFMERFCEEMVARGVDWILLNPAWFISKQQAEAYASVMLEQFHVRATTHRGYLRNYEYDTELYTQQLKRIWSRSWPIQISSHLKDPAWVHDFVHTPDKILGTRFCNKQWLRLDVLPDGKVAPCVQFPDLTVGDLHVDSVDAIWQGMRNREFQKFVHGRALPICSKCDNLYLYGGSCPES